ncbi:MAG TPA: Xaa-Pro peptidase family protein [Chloroflexota bacterium]|nr:Xaa-Pro peptidase family protein [Chloroflexota bacterium]
MIASPGATMGVDFEQRVDYARLRTERLARARAALQASDLGALLLFDMNNIRYVTGTHIGEWARDKMSRYVFLPRTGDPILWDFGSAAKSHRLYAPWLPESSWRAGVAGMRGAMPLDTGIVASLARRIAGEMREHGLQDAPLGLDITDVPTLQALQAEGIRVADGQQVMLNAREVKTEDEIALLKHAAGMVDAAYDELYRALRPGIRENELVGLVNKVLYDLGSDEVEAVNAVSGERCSPHPHVFADRLLRPGDQAYFDIIQAFNGYRTCYYRTFVVGSATPAQLDAYKQCREWIDAAIAAVRPGLTTREIALLWPRAQDFGFQSEEECFGLQFGHGVGLALWERPIISRLNSLEHPVEIKQGMVFALETYAPAADGYSAARIEEEVVVTATGCESIFRFPAEELLVAGTRYFRGADLPAGARG